MKEYDFTDLIELMENSILKMKQISKPKRWRAKNGKRYFYADALFNTCEMPDNYVGVDNELYNVGNYFQTEAECQAFCDKVKALANGNN